MSTAVKRACDACHRRKVKCDGINPCRNCASSRLSCTYNAIPQKKGPKGSRAKVISELREHQRHHSFSTNPYTPTNDVASTATPFTPTQGLLTCELVKTCIDFFFANMYPSMPILNRQRLEQDVVFLDTTLDTYCLLSSLSAFMFLQPGMSMPASDPYGPDNIPGASIITATLLLEETLRVRKSCDYMLNSTLYSLATDYFLFACHYGLELHDKAWYHLRNATTHVHLARMNREETYQALNKVDATCRRRLYWLLYAAERAYALQYDRPLSLKATVDLPTPTDDPTEPPASQLVGFCRTVSLFRHFEGTFPDVWNKTRAGCTQSFVAALQKQHNDAIGTLVGADPQLGDVVRNQQWLRSLTWQVNIAKGNATPHASDMAAYQYSMMDVSRKMLPMAAAFSSQGSADILSSGLIESLFAITCDVMDVLSLMPSSGYPFSASPRDHINQLANILAMLRMGEHRFAPLLLVKVHEVLPRLVNPMLQSPPETAFDIDIFDGFGNAGMVPQQCVSYEDFKADGSSSVGGASSLRVVHSPFVSSPPIMSPGMELSHNIKSEFNPVGDFVMQSRPSVASCITTLSVEGGPNLEQHQQQSSPALQQLLRQSQISQQQQQQQQLHHQQLHQRQLPHQLPQQHRLSPQGQQHDPNQQLQQQQSHPQSVPIPALQNPRNDMSGPPCNDDGLGPSPTMGNGGHQPVDQAQNVIGVLGSQSFGEPMEGINTNHNPNLALQIQQRSTAYGINAQQLRNVGDLQTLRRPSSNYNTLSFINVNSLGTELDFNTLS